MWGCEAIQAIITLKLLVYDMKKLIVGAALAIASLVMPGQVLAQDRVLQADEATSSQEASLSIRKKDDAKKKDTTVIIIIIVVEKG